MTMKVLYVILLFSGCFVYSQSAAAVPCSYPPQQWCESFYIANECKVVDQCLQWLQKQNPIAEAPAVNLELYYEYLCPGCMMFWQSQLWPTWNKIGHIMNITLTPYGNANEQRNGDKWVFECQHGPHECEGNLYETCAIHLLKDFHVYFPFLNCLEQYNLDPMESALQKCTKQWKVDLSALKKCYNSALGNMLEHEMALRTPIDHKYVPWIVINGVHTETQQHKAESDLLNLICDTYTGPKPSGCTKQFVHRSQNNV
ncbi:gamma-interferon-inducible lysosomal thiol reductase-like [Tubulanus polymorphus]|uniref:gamma-interferon-inducible lysosomal thiol reductase-like n=1 Tax=Tubulanus polymorphus TaxID=672921 RepID=UPI003DA66400